MTTKAIASPVAAAQHGREKVMENVPERLRLIAQAMSANSAVTVPEPAKSLSVTEKTVKRDIAKLKKQGRIRRVGPDKGGHWEVIG